MSDLQYMADDADHAIECVRDALLFLSRATSSKDQDFTGCEEGICSIYWILYRYLENASKGEEMKNQLKKAEGGGS